MFDVVLYVLICAARQHKMLNIENVVVKFGSVTKIKFNTHMDVHVVVQRFFYVCSKMQMNSVSMCVFVSMAHDEENDARKWKCCVLIMQCLCWLRAFILSKYFRSIHSFPI